VHLGPFCNCTKLFAKCAKLVQLMQKFVPRCLVRIFRNERSRSTPLDPKLMFLWVSFRLPHLGPFCYCTKLTAKCPKLVQLMQKFVPRCLVRIFLQRTLTTLISCFGAFLSFWVHLGPFRYYTKLATKRAKLVQLMQKFMPRCLVRIFRNEHSWSTPLDTKLMFWCVSSRLGAFGAISLLHETRSNTGQTDAINAKVHAAMSC
jgi:hypothetical protein